MKHFGFDSFLETLLNMESGIDPSKIDLYARYFDARVMDYWKLQGFGEIARDRFGNPIREVVTFREYFASLGHHLVLEQLEPGYLAELRYASVNPWGFVGFQLGEAVLIDSGHYSPRLVPSRDQSQLLELPSFYVGNVPLSAWAHGKKETLLASEEFGPMVATHVNTWLGDFTGLDGIWSLGDLKSPRLQQIVFRRVLKMNLLTIERLIAERGASLTGSLRSISSLLKENITISGCLAAAHLCGATSTASFLLSGASQKDEMGTSLESYIIRFSGFGLA